MIKIAALVSGGGTNLQAVIDAVEEGRITDAGIGLVISSKPDVYALTRAQDAGIKTEVVSKEDFPKPADRTARILQLLSSSNTDLILTLGYLSILGPEIIVGYDGKIINIHPALLPGHGGMGYYGRKVHESVLASGDKVSGATAHYVTDIVDGGDIILQRNVDVLEGDSPESLAARVLEIEHGVIVDAVNMHLAALSEDRRKL